MGDRDETVKVVIQQVACEPDGTLPPVPADSTRLFATTVVRESQTAYRVHLNGQPAGPPVRDEWLADQISQWFAAYLGEQVARAFSVAQVGGAVLDDPQVPPGAGEESGR